MMYSHFFLLDMCASSVVFII